MQTGMDVILQPMAVPHLQGDKANPQESRDSPSSSRDVERRMDVLTAVLSWTPLKPPAGAGRSCRDQLNPPAIESPACYLHAARPVRLQPSHPPNAKQEQEKLVGFSRDLAPATCSVLLLSLKTHTQIWHHKEGKQAVKQLRLHCQDTLLQQQNQQLPFLLS